MEWLLLFILGPPILTLILRILIFIVRYGPGFVGAIFDLICCVLGLVGCIIMLIIRGIMAVFHGLKVLFFGHSSPTPHRPGTLMSIRLSHLMTSKSSSRRSKTRCNQKTRIKGMVSNG